MAKNITLMGADYPAVPAVVLPQTGGGEAMFVDADEFLRKSQFKGFSGTYTFNSSGKLTIQNSFFKETTVVSVCARYANSLSGIIFSAEPQNGYLYVTAYNVIAGAAFAGDYRIQIIAYNE